MGFATGTTVTAIACGHSISSCDFRGHGQDAAIRSSPIVRHAWHLRAESDQLELTRDTLLPELLSGRIRVPEALEVVGEAVG